MNILDHEVSLECSVFVTLPDYLVSRDTEILKSMDS